MAKRAKDAVDYGLGHEGSRCGICVHYITGGSCRLVAGKINPSYWCKFFVKRRSK